MRIAVIADTHDFCPAELPSRLRGADEIWHLGDVGDAQLLADLGRPGSPVHVVAGNCDAPDAWPAELTLEREGWRFYLTHIPPSHAPVNATTVLHGHTHVPRDEVIDGVRWLNPGSVSYPRGGLPPSFAWLTVTAQQIVSWSVVPLVDPRSGRRPIAG